MLCFFKMGQGREITTGLNFKTGEIRHVRQQMINESRASEFVKNKPEIKPSFLKRSLFRETARPLSWRRGHVGAVAEAAAGLRWSGLRRPWTSRSPDNHPTETSDRRARIRALRKVPAQPVEARWLLTPASARPPTPPSRWN